MTKNKNVKQKYIYILIGVIIGVLGIYLILNYTDLLSSTNITKKSTTIVEKNSISEAVNKVKDAVVMIEGYQNNQVSSTGTGFIYKTDNKYGYIMTNQHVIDSTDKIVLIMSDDEEVEATLLGSDQYLDLAVMRIPKNKVKAVAEIGDSSSSSVGDTVFTIGSPLGYEYRGTVTSGILSGKDRMVSVSIGNNTTEDYVMKVLQTDAAINPGNSGGPLLNINGEVIGINSMKLVQEEIEGMGFAIPIEYAMNHVEALEKGNSIDWPVLGISMLNVTDTSALYRNNISVSSNIKSGVVVVSITENSGASKSNLKAGDIITEINGEKVNNIAYLRYELYKYTPNETIEVTYIRDNKQYKTKVTLSKSNN